MRGNLLVYLQLSNRMQVRADIKVIKTKFTKVIQAAAAQTKGTVSCQRFMTAIQIHQEEGRKGRVMEGRQLKSNGGKD